MPGDRPRPGRLLLLGAPLLAVSLALYLLLLPAYQSAVLREVSWLIGVTPIATPLWADAAGHWGTLAGGSERVVLGGPRHSSGAFLALAIVPPLVLLVPGTLAARSRRAALGILAIHAFHVMSLSIYVALSGGGCQESSWAGMCPNLKGVLIYAN